MKTLAAAASTRTVDVDGAQIFVRESGMGTPTLFLHGVPDNGAMWDGVVAELGGSVRAIVPDLPGLGNSTAPAGFSLTLESRANFVDKLLAALGVNEPVNLVVHDFGGHYGLAWAARHPEQARSVTISNTAFFTSYKWHQNAQMWRIPLLGESIMAMASPSLFLNSMKKQAPLFSEQQINDLYTQSMNNPASRKMILRLYRETNPADFAGWEDQSRALLGKIPSAVLWGDRDIYADKGFAEKFGARNVYHFPEYDHWLPIEAPARFAAVLKELFK